MHCPYPQNGDASDPSNFRPITLESVPFKIFTSCLRDSMYDFLQANGFIQHPIQKGFLPKLSGTFEHTAQIRGGSRKFLNGCSRSSGRRAVTTPTFFSETKALRLIGALVLTNLAPLRPLSPPLKRDFLRPRELMPKAQGTALQSND